MKIKFLTFIVLLIFSFSFSQNINVNLKEHNGKPISEVNIQLLKNGKTIDFQKTNNDGIATFRLSEKGVFSLKFTSVFYKSYIIEIDTNEKSSFDVVLEPQIMTIEEVEIKSRPKIATAKEDTIAFNLKAVRDGTERTTEDLIKKLPGLDVNENGKVTYKGNTIGQVLIDGNEFFGKNHKIATQNISADMVDGIDIWKNFSTINGNRSTALNLKLKEGYKGKVTGNFEGNYGNKNSYFAHTNLFRFNKLGNLALIADANNIAKDPINFMDFYEMNTQEDIDDSDSKDNIDIPSFLNNDGKVKSKSNQFGALQYSKSKKNFSITAFSIFNNAQLNKLSSSKRQVFEGQPQSYNFLEQKMENNRGFFGTTQIKVKKTFSDNSFLYYNFGYSPNRDHFNQDIERYSTDYNFFGIKNTTQNSSIGNFISWNKELLSSTNLILSLSQLRETYSGTLSIDSNNNLFGGSNNSLSQLYAIKSNKYTFDLFLKNKNKIINFNFHSGFSYKEDDSDLSEAFSLNYEKRNLKVYHYLNDVFLYKQFGKFDLSASMSSNFLNINNVSKHYFEKRATIKFTPDSNAFELGYSSKYMLPNLKLLQYNSLYTKDLSFYENMFLTPDLLSKTESYKLSWYKLNFDKGNSMFFMLLYDRTKPSYATNTINYGNFSEIQNVIGNKNDRLIFLLTDDYRFRRNYILKSKLSGVISKASNFINNNSNISTVTNFELSQKISTNFKNKPIQFDLGYTFSKGIFEQSYYNINAKQDNIKLSLGIRANLKKEWIANVLGEYLIQKTEQSTLKNFLLGGQISYKKEKSKIEYNLMFNNILNLNSFQYISNYTSQLGTDELSTTALHGYIIGGLKFYF